MPLHPGIWTKSTHSAECNCVEVKRIDNDVVLVRNDRNSYTNTPLAFTRDEWTTFLDGVRDGEFDL